MRSFLLFLAAMLAVSPALAGDIKGPAKDVHLTVAAAAVPCQSGTRTVSIRRTVGDSYEVVSSTPRGTETKTVTVRQTVGNSYEVTVK